MRKAQQTHKTGNQTRQQENLAMFNIATNQTFEYERPGFNISTSPLAPASEFLKKGLSGKYILVFNCLNGQADFLSTINFFM